MLLTLLVVPRLSMCYCKNALDYYEMQIDHYPPVYMYAVCKFAYKIWQSKFDSFRDSSVYAAKSKLSHISEEIGALKIKLGDLSAVQKGQAPPSPARSQRYSPSASDKVVLQAGFF